MAAVERWGYPETDLNLNGDILLIRADTGPTIGAGHLMRCLALAQAWQFYHGNSVFLTAFPTAPSFDKRLDESGMVKYTLVSSNAGADAMQTLEYAHKLSARAIILDGRSFGPDYQALVKRSGIFTAVIDDEDALQPYKVDLVIRQNIEPTNDLDDHHTGGTAHTLLHGSQYLMLRKEFILARQHVKPIADRAHNLLVTLGAADPVNFTETVLNALTRTDLDFDVKVIVGRHNQRLASLQQFADRHGFSIHTDVEDMSPFMLWADLAITAGGGTCIELAYLGVPCLIVAIASDQNINAQTLADSQAAINLGWYAHLRPDTLLAHLLTIQCDCNLRQQLRYNSMMLLDGLGASRITHHIANQTRRD